MNERIKHLLAQSHGEAVDIRDTNWIANRFAELIVRECCEILRENVEVALNASGSPVYPEGLIREHFGVEE